MRPSRRISWLKLQRVGEAGLAMGAGTTTMPHEVCAPFWDNEFHVPDFTKWTELASGPQRAADLHAATGGRPERSARWREFSSLIGFDAELRCSLTAGGATWGIVQLNRAAGSSSFFSTTRVSVVRTIAAKR